MGTVLQNGQKVSEGVIAAVEGDASDSAR
jgi:hypothetical protein